MHTESYFLNDPELQDKVPTSYLSHKEVYEDSIRKSAIVLKKLKTLQDEGNCGPELQRYANCWFIAKLLFIIWICDYIVKFSEELTKNTSCEKDVH